jgi:hypothetical protein
MTFRPIKPAPTRKTDFGGEVFDAMFGSSLHFHSCQGNEGWRWSRKKSVVGDLRRGEASRDHLSCINDERPVRGRVSKHGTIAEALPCVCNPNY